MAAYLVEKKAFCPMKKTIIAEQAQFPSTSPAGVRSVCGDPLWSPGGKQQSSG